MKDFFTTGSVFCVATADGSRIYHFIDGIVIIVCINH